MVTDGLSITTESLDDGVVVVHVCGEVDLFNASKLDAALQTVDGSVVIDLAALSFIDGRGLEVFAAAQQRAVSRGDRLSVINATPMTRRLLQVCALENLLDLGSDAP